MGSRIPCLGEGRWFPSPWNQDRRFFQEIYMREGKISSTIKTLSHSIHKGFLITRLPKISLG
jgi:hypothetical protein